MSEPWEVVERVLRGDTSIFRVSARLTQEDKKSLLAVHAAIHRRGERFAYLEIGSFLGGSLQTFLLDDLCTNVYSIDKRPQRPIEDERGVRNYSGVTTQMMKEELKKYYQVGLEKLECIDGDTSEIDIGRIEKAPVLCFIDGEHTHAASFRDFVFCATVAAEGAVILFHDAHLVFRGIEQALKYLAERNVAYYAYNMPDYLCVVELGRLGLFRDEALLERILMCELGSIQQLGQMERYRERFARLERNPLYRVARRAKQLASHLLSLGPEWWQRRS